MELKQQFVNYVKESNKSNQIVSHKTRKMVLTVPINKPIIDQSYDQQYNILPIQNTVRPIDISNDDGSEYIIEGGNQDFDSTNDDSNKIDLTKIRHCFDGPKTRYTNF